MIIKTQDLNWKDTVVIMQMLFGSTEKVGGRGLNPEMDLEMVDFEEESMAEDSQNSG